MGSHWLMVSNAMLEAASVQVIASSHAAAMAIGEPRRSGRDRIRADHGTPPANVTQGFTDFRVSRFLRHSWADLQPAL